MLLRTGLRDPRALQSAIAILYSAPAGVLIAMIMTLPGPIVSHHLICAPTPDPAFMFVIVLFVPVGLAYVAKKRPLWTTPALQGVVLACEISILYLYIAHVITNNDPGTYQYADWVAYGGLGLSVFLLFGMLLATDSRRKQFRRGVGLATFAPVTVLLALTSAYAYGHESPVLGHLIIVFFVFPCCLQLVAVFIGKPRDEHEPNRPEDAPQQIPHQKKNST